MPPSFLDTPIEFLTGVGPTRAETLKKEARIFTYRDLLFQFPFRYVDKSKFHKVAEIRTDAVHVQLKGKLTRLEEVGKDRAKRLTATFEDETGQIELVWFRGIKWLKPKLKTNVQYILYGKPSRFNGKYNIGHPELETADSVRLVMGASLKPVYGSTEKLSAKWLNSNGLEKLCKNLVQTIKGQIPEFLPAEWIERLKMPSREFALYNIHAPSGHDVLERCRNRMKFEELLLLQLSLIRNKISTTRKLKGVVFETIGENFNEFFHKQLPFELTNAQKRVVKEVRKDVQQGYHMNRLVQGDVGSGKTVVALITALIAIDNGFQVCLMAPTEILARQHYKSIGKMLSNMDINIGILTGSSKTAERRKIHEELESGEMNILIGTHALIEPKVKFNNLGLAIIDEQHRFGVAQREKLWRKAALPPHVMVMTATPIPRTLAMTLYGDLDISVIDELPPGRKSIKTMHSFEKDRLKMFGFIEKEVAKGRQVYIVYPLIEESEAMDYKDLMDGYESISRRFPLPDYRISIVHGKMKPEDKEYEMNLFAKGDTHIMVSTTVIEVGVDVPNASVMVIESAEKFGLSQLHQLRGRVGRGADQSYCILMSSYKLSNEAKIRLETMVRTTDGFEIAEVDLNLRGPGNIMGTQQSGVLDLKIADLAKDQEILKTARHIATLILEEDPELEAEKHKGLKKEMQRMVSNKRDWGLIS